MVYNLYPIADEPQSQVRDKVYQQLRQAVLKGGLKPGDRLIERKLAEQLKVSRTPVREAIRMLELEGLVSHIPRIGVVVARIDDQEVYEIYRIRAVLEGLASRMAAERIEPPRLQELTALLEQIEACAAGGDLIRLEKLHREFNDSIYRTAGSPRLYTMITSLTDYITRYARVGYAHPGRLAEATREHRQLVEAIKLRDGDLAERVAREHINNSRHAYFRETTMKKEK
ncbi:MAG: GntR family transcriptional regulator [Bacillota bacterium]